MIKPKTTSFPLAVLFCFAAVLGAARPGAGAPPRRVAFTAAVTPAKARPGETVTVQVKAAISPSWHLYGMTPVPPPGPQETVLTVKAGPLTPVGKPTESATKKAMDPNFGKEVAYHEDAATFTQRLRVPENARPGSVPLTTTVRYMLCNESVCLPPRDADVAATVAIEAGAARPEYTVAAATADTTGGGGTTGDGSGSNTAAAAGSLLPFVFAAFGAGLLALLTPCVFPMIPVTLAFFTKQATAKGENAQAARGTMVRLAASYSLGIIVSFTLIGAVLAATIGATGANRLFTNPWLNLAFAALFVIFGLALLEIIELRLPRALQGFAGAGNRHGGTLGVLGMGLTFVAAAFTCTAPFMGTVLIAAADASTGAQWVRPIVGMGAFATALALPFFLLALFPGWLARLPRSGAWLSTVKGAMGFLEIAAALKFFSNADMVQGWGLLPRPLFLAIWGILGLGAALWLLGVLRLGFSTPEGRPSLARGAWAAAFALLGLYCLYGVTGRPLASDLVAFLPPADYGLPAAAQSADTAHGGLSWHKTLDAALADAKTQNKPLFVDFTGYTCTNCRWMENNVFPDPAVKGELSQFVRVQLYTDGADEGSKQNQGYQEKTFGDVALPLYAIVSPDGTPREHSAGITRDPQEFARFLREGREKELAARGTATASVQD